jgi:hypothetical protein
MSMRRRIHTCYVDQLRCPLPKAVRPDHVARGLPVVDYLLHRDDFEADARLGDSGFIQQARTLFGVHCRAVNKANDLSVKEEDTCESSKCPNPSFPNTGGCWGRE